MAYDEATGQTILFGGWRTTGQRVLGDTWAWNGTAWAQLHPATSPTPRWGPAMAYDPARRQILLFGGRELDPRGNDTNDTWAWDGTTWTQLHPAASPPVRVKTSLAYDSVRDRVVLFGGSTWGSHYYNDTWEWDGATWTQMHPPVSPRTREGQMMAFDTALGRTVVFGGNDGPTPLGSTWTWDGTSWTHLDLTVSPRARNGQATSMVYDPRQAVIVMFGGWNQHVQRTLGDTWQFSASGWTRLHPPGLPGPRAENAMAYDTARDRIVMFGGFAAIDPAYGTWKPAYGTWEWDGTTWTNALRPPAAAR